MNSPKPLAMAGNDQDDDMRFTRVLYDEVHRRKAKCIIASDGESGLELAMQFMPDAIILDIDLLGMSGLAVFYQIIGNPSLAHIPVYFISVPDDLTTLAPHDAIAYLTKPISRIQRDVAPCLT